jgi:wyosine [tRNA(Phe)-imidazoG37] synthetase (radical SAM superfamily)
VDVVPAKTCPLDCIYCQLGRTTTKTVQRGEFVPLPAVLEELSRVLEKAPRPDCITLAGSGEPTLYRKLGELIDRIHELTDVPVALLTDGVLFFDPAVREEASRADLILPSLDAGDEPTFQRINRPQESLSFEKCLSGLQAFCREFGGKVWLEVFIVKDVNDAREQVAKIAAITKDLGVAKVQLNTAVRPATEGWVQPASPEQLQQLAACFDPPAEVIADFPDRAPSGEFTARSEDVLDTLRRRPCTLEDITCGLAIKAAEAAKILETLIRADRIKTEDRQGRRYYVSK